MIVRKIIKWNWIQIIRLLWIIFRYLIFQVSSLCRELKYLQPPVNFSSEILGVLSSSKQGPSSLCIWKSLFSRWERKIACIILLKKKKQIRNMSQKGGYSSRNSTHLFVPLSRRTAETTFVNEAVSHMFSQNFWKPGKLDLTLNFNRI